MNCSLPVFFFVVVVVVVVVVFTIQCNWWITGAIAIRTGRETYFYNIGCFLQIIARVVPTYCCLLLISIYTLSDLGDLSNLVGSLSRTIEQYSPPSE